MRNRRILGILGGATVGGIIGAIVAVNIVIYGGTEEGYESSFSDVFEHNVAVGILAVGVLIAGPIIGVLVDRRIRRREML